MTENKYLSITQAAKKFNISRQRIYELISKGVFKKYTTQVIVTKTAVSVDELKKWKNKEHENYGSQGRPPKKL